MKKVSIAMITYNHEKYISKALDSILSQDVDFDYEIIIGEDYSKDGTLSILKSYELQYPNKIKVIHREKNIGIPNNFLEVLSECSGDYIALLEGDDYWISNNKLKKTVEFLEHNPSYIGAFHNINVIDHDNTVKEKHPFHRSKNYCDINSLEEHYDGKIMMTLSMVFKNIFKEKKYLKEYFSLLKNVKYACDYSLKAYLLTFGKFKYIDEVMANYRHIDNFGDSWSAQKEEVHLRDFIHIYKNHMLFFGERAERKLKKHYIDTLSQYIYVLIKYFKIKEISNILKENENIRYKEYFSPLIKTISKDIKRKRRGLKRRIFNGKIK